MTPMDFWRSWWCAWFSIVQHQVALQEQALAMVFPGTLAGSPKGSALCGAPPTQPAPRKPRRATP